MCDHFEKYSFECKSLKDSCWDPLPGCKVWINLMMGCCWVCMCVLACEYICIACQTKQCPSVIVRQWDATTFSCISHGNKMTKQKILKTQKLKIRKHFSNCLKYNMYVDDIFLLLFLLLFCWSFITYYSPMLPTTYLYVICFNITTTAVCGWQFPTFYRLHVYYFWYAILY